MIVMPLFHDRPKLINQSYLAEGHNRIVGDILIPPGKSLISRLSFRHTADSKGIGLDCG